MNKYKIYCETDNKWEYSTGMNEPLTCPTDPSHIIKDGSCCVEKENYNEDYRIMEDASEAAHHQDVYSINYKTELKSGVSYTPIYTISFEGETAGLLEKTEYYKDFVDSNSKGTLVLVVEENYVIDNSDPLLNHTAKTTTQRTKTWKQVKKDGSIEETSTKVKTKIYDTRRKRHIESERRRGNIIEQFIDHIGLAGLLSGTFANIDDAYDSLTALQELHASAFSGWLSSGRGSLIDVVENDTVTLWLDDVVADNPSTQAMCPWMIGLTFREYTQEKLKGNIK